MPVKDGPWFVLVGGINGAGKSTFSQNQETLKALLQLSDTDQVEVINPDVVTSAILAADPMMQRDVANKVAADQCEVGSNDAMGTSSSRRCCRATNTRASWSEHESSAGDSYWSTSLCLQSRTPSLESATGSRRADTRFRRKRSGIVGPFHRQPRMVLAPRRGSIPVP